VFPRNADGTYEVLLPIELRRLLGAHLEGLRTRLMADEDDPDMRRLFPTAYNQHQHLDEEYQRLMRSELLASRLTALDTVEQTLAVDTLTADDLNQWMQSINSLRLVLGTSLDVSEEPRQPDPDDPRIADYELYDLLNFVLVAILDALQSGTGQAKRRRFWQR
jgi:uncharacterized protein DUF2017